MRKALVKKYTIIDFRMNTLEIEYVKNLLKKYEYTIYETFNENTYFIAVLDVNEETTAYEILSRFGFRVENILYNEKKGGD